MLGIFVASSKKLLSACMKHWNIIYNVQQYLFRNAFEECLILS